MFQFRGGCYIAGDNEDNDSAKSSASLSVEPTAHYSKKAKVFWKEVIFPVKFSAKLITFLSMRRMAFDIALSIDPAIALIFCALAFAL